MQSNRNISLIIGCAALVIVVLAFVGRWSVARVVPAVPATGGDETAAAIDSVASTTTTSKNGVSR